MERGSQERGTQTNSSIDCKLPKSQLVLEMGSHTSNSELPSKAMGEEKSPVEVKIEVYKSIMAKESEKDVVEICRRNQWVLGEVIAASGDTVLHKIVSDGKEDIVKQLMGIIKPEDLEKANKIGNNLLHMAASAGSAKMCESFSTINPELLMNSRNKDGETPLFLAVSYGRKEAFLFLHQLSSCRNNQDCLCLSRKNNGDTILHCAIAGDYFELALLIIQRHKELVSYVNEKGISPLHLLATRPTAFQSGSDHGRWSWIIYYSKRVDKPQEATTSTDADQMRRREPQGLFWQLKNCIYSTVCAAYCNSRGWRHEQATDVEEPPKQSGSKSNEEDSLNINKFELNKVVNFVVNKVVNFVKNNSFVILAHGKNKIRKIEKEKKKHKLAAKVLEELAKISATQEYYATGGQPMKLEESWADTIGIEPAFVKKNRKSPILLAAENGIDEVVEAIIEHIPMAINDMDSQGKNVVLLAVENRRFNVYKLLLERFTKHDSIFHKIDDEGNTALHHAATQTKYNVELNLSSTLIMQQEIKFFKDIKKHMPPHLLSHLNKKGKTAKEVFNDKHEVLIKKASEDVNKMANSCSVVATLVATVAFATSATIPGGPNDKHGRPVLERHPAFTVFAISSLLALCTSIFALVIFLSMLTTQHSMKYFRKKLPSQILWGVTWLLVSLALMVVSYCWSHFFLLKDLLKIHAPPIYSILGAAITLFIVIQFMKSFFLFRYLFHNFLVAAIWLLMNCIS